MGLGAKLILATVGGLGVVGTGFVATAAVTGPGRVPAPVITLDPAAVRENQAAATPPDTAGADPGVVGATISVDVAPGPLTVLEPPATVHLQRVAGTDEFHGAVRGLRIVDARGTNAG